MRSLWMIFSPLLLVSCSPISSTAPYVVHEARKHLPPGWQRDSRLPADLVLPVRIGLAQSNLHRAEELILQVSHPESPSYGKHWTPEQVQQTFAPSQESYKAVASWLKSSSIPYKIDPLGWIDFEACANTLEKLFHTEYYLYEYEGNGLANVGCESYSVPADLQEHIDIVVPSVHFDTRSETPGSKKQKRLAELKKRNFEKRAGVKPFRSGARRNDVAQVTSNVNFNISTCGRYITPYCLRALYQFGVNHNPVEGNSYGITEYTPQEYVQSDLDGFFSIFQPALVGQSPILDAVDGGYHIATDPSLTLESDLDLEYAMAIVYPQKVTLYQVGDIPQQNFTFANNFLDAIDASYCTYEGGDDPNQDGIYPDPLPGGYKAQDCGKYQPTLVISTSYGATEHDYTPFYQMRQCHEYMKLGLMGVSVLYSSGDFGVAGNGQCIDPATGEYNDGFSGQFIVTFPGNCPYVTSVGATQLVLGQTVKGPESVLNSDEYGTPFNFSGGGGFSNIFSIPSWQVPAVSHYLTTYPPPYTSVQYNNSGMARGMPDVSANGNNYVVYLEGGLGLVGGTSASSPVFGSIVTLLNQDRLYHKKSPLGFLNPTLYAHPELFHDITLGHNVGCGTDGFAAQPGWDPVTGLGTPDFTRMRHFFNNLP